MLIPATLVEGLQAQKRRLLHLQAAAALEIRSPDDFEALAHHYQQAGEAEKAAGYLLQAGDRARGLYAHQEAIDHYRQALDLLQMVGDLEQVARTQMKLGLTYHNAFDFRAARQAYHEGFALWQRLADGRLESVSLSAGPAHALRITAVEPAILSPGSAMDLPSAVMEDQLFSGLVEVTPEMGVVPDVARSWQLMDGGRKYVFYLRDDVYWSDGVPVTAEDFAYAFKRALDPARQYGAASLVFDVRNAKAYHRGQLTDPAQVGVRALAPLTLVVELEAPTSYFPYVLAFTPMFAVPRHVVEVHGEAWAEPGNIVTNGPFRLAGWERGMSMILERNPTYHGRFTGNVERVECSFLSGRPARLLQMYEENRLDIFCDLPPAEMSRARHRYAGEYVSGPRLSIDFVGFDVSRPPFDDPRVRRAFTLATDREALADVTLRGYAFPATGGFVPPGMPGHSPGIGLPYDPETARQLLADAGYPGGRGFPALDCIARNDPGHDLMCDYLQAQWLATLGVEIDWQEVAWVRFPARMSKETPHLWMVGYWADYPDPDDYLRVMWWLPPGWRHNEYRRLVEDGRRAMVQEERMRLYQQADRILVEEAPVLPLCYARFHMLVKPWVKRYLTSPLRWWFWKDVILEAH
jgi:oligopeptide transport system substrate-binding protein